jgi:tripartite-type tricarboxylate transporter receptor subunit TctC
VIGRPLAIAASGSLKVDSLAALVQLARSRGGRLNWAATPGVPYFAFAGLQKSTGIDMVQVSYRDFNQAIADLGEAASSVRWTRRQRSTA